MTDSIRETAVKRFKALLLGVGPGFATGCKDSVFRSRMEAIERKASPALVVEPGEGEDSAAVSDGADQNAFDIDVSVVTRGDPYDALADPICVQAHILIMQDTTLGGLVERIRKVRTQWRGLEADATAGAVTMRYRLTYFSDARDITRAPQF